MAANSYKETDYFSHPVSRAHPDHLRCIGKLFGMQPPAVESCQILELGCGDGGNIIPLAAHYPNANFFGVDLSERAIQRGQERIRKAGLTNIELAVRDLKSFEPQRDKFDYVIAHGLYSWVADPIKKRSLQIIRNALSPQGIAFVSYNTFPGWHQRLITREFVEFHTVGIEDPKLKVIQAKAAMEFLANSAAPRAQHYRAVLTEEKNTINSLMDWHFLHDYLEENNDPRYFTQFIMESEAEGLQYLGDSELSQMLPLEFPKEVQDRVAKLSRDTVRMEQYLDFLRNRMFRRTLLVRDDVTIRREFRPVDIGDLYVASALKPEKGAQGEIRFAHPNGGGLNGGDPILIRALEFLYKIYPSDISFSELERQLGPGTLAGSMLKFGISDLVELRTASRRIPAAVSEIPTAFRLARSEADLSAIHPNILHEMVGVDELERALLRLADGRRTVLQIAEQLLASGAKNQPRDNAIHVVRVKLEELRRKALLSAG